MTKTDAAPSNPRGEAADSSGGRFVDALRRRESWALAEMFDRHHKEIERVLIGMLGADPEVSDIAQEVLVRAIRSIEGFRGDARALRRWLIQIAVRVAKNHFRHVSTRPWLKSREPDLQGHEPPANWVTPEVYDALRRTYQVVSTMPDDERVVFTLRVLERMELTEVADACGISLATVKRRVTKATKRFEKRAAKDPVLRGWMEEVP